ncbi:hypothetical protein [Pontibacter pamirensis]|uniref:hypothetical protein n=1 Tax=Pontibacter pamirensis TaxID=2562824 RepID=UPI00138A247A|nr:hypothetical protein [Pontibacter pamirensis]
MENDKEKAPQQDRMEQDVKNTSRTMQPGKAQDSDNTGMPKGKGRGWHGDSEGHAKAGSQSHKKSGD